MSLPSLDDAGDVSGRRIFVRVDYNVPLEGGRITDDTRIVASTVPGGAKVVFPIP